MKVVVNEYELVFSNGSSKVVCAQSVRDAALVEDTTALPIVAITRKRVGVTIEVASPPELTVTTSVTPAAAVTAGCRAYPASFEVLPGQIVIFSAVPAAGYGFVGWFRDGTQLSSELEVELPINAPAVGVDVAIEARFIALP